jgi:hypothetical protein
MINVDAQPKAKERQSRFSWLPPYHIQSNVELETYNLRMDFHTN